MSLIATLLIASAQAVSAPVNGWTEADVISALTEAGLTEVAVNTADPNLPSASGRFNGRFPVDAIRMACTTVPPSSETNCSGVWLTVAMPSTEARWATRILNSLERRGQPPLGVNVFLETFRSPSQENRPVVMLDSYVIADGGVHPGLLSAELRTLLGFAEQTEGFMISDDPSHMTLWDGPSAER